MNVHLHDDRTLALSFAYNPATVARVKALGAQWDKERKEWHLPLSRLRRVADEFPGAQVEAECVAARLDLWRRWIAQHNAWGIWFAYADDGHTVVPVSDEGELSPCFVAHVAERSAVLSQFLGDQVFPAAPPPVRTVEPTEGDRLLMRSIQNAARNEERRGEVIERAKGRRRQAKQLTLLEDA